MKIFDIVFVVSFSTAVLASKLPKSDQTPILQDFNKDPRTLRYYGCPSPIEQVQLDAGDVLNWIFAGTGGPSYCGFNFVNPFSLILSITCDNFFLTRGQKLIIKSDSDFKKYYYDDGPVGYENSGDTKVALKRRYGDYRTFISCTISALPEQGPAPEEENEETEEPAPEEPAPEEPAPEEPAPEEPTPETRSCECGLINRSARIVGGSETEANEYPYQAALVYPGRFAFCGGSLINDRYILTAAHCVTDLTKDEFQVVLGAHDVKNSGTLVNVKNIIAHSGYNSVSLDNDIALLEIDPQTLSGEGSAINPICLPSAGQTFFGEEVVTSGWGRLSDGGSQPDKLYEVALTMITDQECARTYGSNNLSPNMICATEAGKDSCQGDSGGPLAFINQDKAVLTGVVSWGVGCAVYPGVYAEVSNYIDWINSNTAGAEYCDQ